MLLDTAGPARFQLENGCRHRRGKMTLRHRLLSFWLVIRDTDGYERFTITGGTLPI
jgi:hypothetical protein